MNDMGSKKHWSMLVLTGEIAPGNRNALYLLRTPSRKSEHVYPSMEDISGLKAAYGAGMIDKSTPPSAEIHSQAKGETGKASMPLRTQHSGHVCIPRHRRASTCVYIDGVLVQRKDQARILVHMLQLLFVSMHWVIKKYGISALYLLAFVLKTYWMALQGKLIGCFITILNSATVHQGVNFSFKLDYHDMLSSGDTSRTWSLSSKVK